MHHAGIRQHIIDRFIARRGRLHLFDQLVAARTAKAGGQVIWVNHANVATAAGSDWSGFFDRFVAADFRQRTIKSLAPGREGRQVWAGVDFDAQDIHIIKNRYSAPMPGSSSLERVLRSLRLETVLIAGTKTNVCCESTARDAMITALRFPPLPIELVTFAR